VSGSEGGANPSPSPGSVVGGLVTVLADADAVRTLAEGAGGWVEVSHPYKRGGVGGGGAEEHVTEGGWAEGGGILRLLECGPPHPAYLKASLPFPFTSVTYVCQAMGRFCGRTGQVVGRTGRGNPRVMFATGEAFVYSPAALAHANGTGVAHTEGLPASAIGLARVYKSTM
jgi:hypothetical protein